MSRMFDSIYGAYLEQSYWFESVMFAEKLLLNGVMLFIAQPAAQMTFGLLTAALLVMLQVHVNPFNEVDLGILANLLAVAIFLTLLVGAHTELHGDEDWTADALLVQNSIIAAALVCVILGLMIIARDAWAQLTEARAKHIKDYEAQQERLGLTQSPKKRKSSLLGRLIRKMSGATSPGAEDLIRQAYNANAVAPSDAEDAVWWAIEMVAPQTAPPVSPLVQAAFLRELHRQFDGTLAPGVSMEFMMQNRRSRKRKGAGGTTPRSSTARAPTGLCKRMADACVAAAAAAASTSLPTMAMLMADLTSKALTAGPQRCSVLVRTDACLCRAVCRATAPSCHTSCSLTAAGWTSRQARVPEFAANRQHRGPQPARVRLAIGAVLGQTRLRAESNGLVQRQPGRQRVLPPQRRVNGRSSDVAECGCEAHGSRGSGPANAWDAVSGVTSARRHTAYAHYGCVDPGWFTARVGDQR